MSAEEYVLPAPGATVEITVELRVDSGIATTIVGTFNARVLEGRLSGEDGDDPAARAYLRVSARDLASGFAQLAASYGQAAIRNEEAGL